MFAVPLPSTSLFFVLHPLSSFFFSFFFTDPAPTEIYTLSLHDALPISCAAAGSARSASMTSAPAPVASTAFARSEEHTSELQSLRHLVCRLLLEKKKKKNMKKKHKKQHTYTHILTKHNSN